LTAGEVHYRLVTAPTAKVETAEEIPQHLLAFRGSQTLQVQQRARLWIQRVELMLGEVANGQIFTTLQPAAKRLQLASQGLDQGRLASPVRPQKTDSRAGHQLQLDLLQHRSGTIAEADLGHVEQR